VTAVREDRVSPPALRRGHSALPPSPLTVLAAAGIADRPALDRAVLSDLSRSHDTALVTMPGGTAYVVKRTSAGTRETGRSLTAELYVYRLASWQPDLAAVLPAPVLIDERRQLLALVAAPVERLFAARGAGGSFRSPALGAAMGTALAAVHASTVGTPIPTAAACGVLQLPETPEEHRFTGGSAAATAVAGAVVADDVLAAVLRRGARALRPLCLVHADVKWDNAVLDPGPPARVTLFDWELSGLGDPAWDVGSALADSVALDVRLSDAPGPTAAASLTPAMTALLDAYGRTARGRGADFITGPDVAARVVLSWIARTVHLAMEYAAAVEDGGHFAVGRLLATARALAAAEQAVTDDVERALVGSP
jgi:hypothetical protein